MPQRGFDYRVVLIHRHEHADATYPLILLRAYRNWPGAGRSTEQCDEIARFMYYLKPRITPYHSRER